MLVTIIDSYVTSYVRILGGNSNFNITPMREHWFEKKNPTKRVDSRGLSSVKRAALHAFLGCKCR